jgi:hypothetical protein
MKSQLRIPIGPLVITQENAYSGRRPSRRSNRWALIVLACVLAVPTALFVIGMVVS